MRARRVLVLFLLFSVASGPRVREAGRGYGGKPRASNTGGRKRVAREMVAAGAAAPSLPLPVEKPLRPGICDILTARSPGGRATCSGRTSFLTTTSGA